MDTQHNETEKKIQDPKLEIKADALVGGLEVIPRRQDKIIAAIVRKNSSLILQREVALTTEERKNFLDRTDTSRLDRLRDSDFEAALALTQGNIKEPRNEENLQNIWQQFSGEKDEDRRKRRVVAHISRGNIAAQDKVESGDLYTVARQRCRNAVAFERMIPQILASVDDADVYKPIIHDVGLALYGSQWVYLQQGRLAESRKTERHEDRKASLDERLQIFSQTESPVFVNLPQARYSLDDLKTSNHQGEIGDYRVCYDKTLDREGIGNVVTGYHKETGEIKVFKLSESSTTENAKIEKEEQVKRRISNTIPFTYEDKQQYGNQIVRRYPLIPTDLKGYIDRNGSIDPRKALGMTIEIGQCLREMHKNGLMHTDVATANIFIDTSGKARLADFDTIIIQGEALSHEQLAGGNVFLKPPELYEGKPGKLETIDTYEMSVLLYESIVAQNPFDHIPWNPEEEDSIRRRRFYEAKKNADFIIPSDVPDAIQRIVKKGLQPDPNNRYQSMDDMLGDLLDAYDVQDVVNSKTNEHALDLVRQPNLIDKPVVSEVLASNPEAVLDAGKEMRDYIARQDPEYIAQLQKLTNNINEPMHTDTKAVVCIPVAAAQESANIFKTLEGFAQQSLASQKFEVLLMLNIRESLRSTKQSDIDKTLAEIERAKMAYPDLAVRIADVTVPDEQFNIWNLRKITTDLAILRAIQVDKKDDILLLSNDSDNQGISPDYLKNYIDYFAAHPDKEGAVGNLQYDPQAFIRFPEMAIENEFAVRLDQQGFKNGNVMLFGGNSVMKASIYSAIGGYPSTVVEGAGGEQGWTGKTIREMRKKKSTLGYVDNALLTTSSRRDVLQYLEDPERSVTFGDTDAESRMRALDVNTLPIFDWDDLQEATKMQAALTRKINATITQYESGEHLGKDSWYYRTNLEALGIKYRVEGDPKSRESKVVITDMRGFVERQKKMKQIILSGEKNMAKVFQAAA